VKPPPARCLPMAGRRTTAPCAASPLLESRELRPRKTLQETSRRRWSWSWQPQPPWPLDAQHPAVAFPVRPGQPDDRPVRRPGAGAAGWRFGWPRAAYCLRRRAVQPSPGRRRGRPPASGPADSRPGQRLLLATVRLAGPSQPQQQEIELHAAIAERLPTGARSVVAGYRRAFSPNWRRQPGSRAPSCMSRTARSAPAAAAGPGRRAWPTAARLPKRGTTACSWSLPASRSWAGCCWSPDCSRPSYRIPPSVPFGQHLE
jgi:hypothetical protein